MKPLHPVLGALLCTLALGLATACGGGTSPKSNGGGGGGDAPVVTMVFPSSDYTPGGSVVQIGGANFSGTLTVTFGDVAVANVTILNESVVQATVPAHAAGLVDVVVSNAGGDGTLANGFTYTTFPPALPATDRQIDTDAATPLAEDPAMCCSGSSVFVAWAEPRGGALNDDVWFQGSFNRGTTWRTTDVRVNRNVAGASDSTNVVICCNGLLVHVAWLDNRNGPYEPFFNRSVDGGNTWLNADLRLNTPLAGTTNTWVPSLTMCCDGNTVVVAWSDDRNNFPPGGFDVFAARSIDGGSSFAADKRVNTNTAGALPAAPKPRLCCRQPNVYITWEDRRAGLANADVRFNRSSDNGSSWLGTDVRLDQDAGVRNATDPRICCDGSHVYVGWRDDRAAATPLVNFDVYVRGSANGGANFNATETRVNTNTAGSAFASKIDICCAAQNVYVTWSDNRNLGDGVWFNRSTNAAVSFQAADVPLDVGAPLLPNGPPQICCTAAGRLTVIWSDGRAGAPPFEIYSNSSSNSGASWQTTDLRLDTDTPAAGTSFLSSQYNANLCCDGGFFYAVWLDSRNAAGAGFDIFFNGNIP